MSLGQIVPWRRRAVEALAPRDGGRYLDVGAGTGELTRLILRRAPEASVVALDASPAMLEAGKLGGDPRVEPRVGDANRTGLPPASLDGAASGFMLRHLPSFDVFFAELSRILKPGAMLVLLEAYYPPRLLPRLLFRLYFFGFAWILGALVTRTWAAHVGLYRSVRAFPGIEALEAAAQRHGFSRSRLARGAWSGFFLLALRKERGPSAGS